MSKSAHLDIESFSACDLKDAGVHRYSEHASTEVLCFAYAFDEGDVKLWKPGEPLPQDLVEHVKSGGEIRAHNAQFERVVLNGVAGKKIGFPEIKIEQTTCTMAKMSAAGMPRSLDDAAKALGVPGKAEGGRFEMLALAKPRKPTKADPSVRWTLKNAPEKYEVLYAYNIQDVIAERGIGNAVPDLIASEQHIYHLDQRINQRGIAVDLTAVANILAVVEEYKSWLGSECERLTADYLGDGLKPTQREKISDWVRANGWPGLLDMQAETVKALCKREEVPCLIKQVLRIYSTYNAKAVSKLQAILDAVCADGRLRGMFLFLGAGTGRWSSLIVQLQNLMRPFIDDPDFALECFSKRSLDFVRMMYPDIDLMKVAGSCIRAVLIAASGKTLLFPDFVGVELRINAWLWGEEAELQVYRNQDAGTGPDSYKLTYCEFFAEDIDAIDWKSLEGKNKRQIGKVLCLAFGYEGGVSAGVTMVDTYGVDLDKMAAALLPIMPEDARQHAEWMWLNHRKEGVTKEQSMALDGAKYMWRQRRPHIKQGWKDLKEAAGLACEFPGKTFLAGKIAFRVCSYKERSWLHMRLPSGRDLKYYSPRWIEPKNIKRPKKLDNGYGGYTWVEEEVIIPGEFRYFGVDSRTHQWTEQTSYGGQLDADADQGFASDLLRNGMRNAERLGFPIVATVHDELVSEVDEEHASIVEIEKGMLDQPAYTAGLPLAVETKRCRHYWKG
jgi:DNA polymerase